jgi:alpha-L-fucosidase 2
MKPTLKHLAALLTAMTAQAAEMKLWYDKPAASWMTEALPIGNGDLGAMVFGKTGIERIQFNEKSLWTGNEADTGSYQAFGDLFIKLDHEKPQDYRRELDLERGVQTVSYVSNGVRYRRELFASYPAGVIAIRLTADKPGAYFGKLWLTDVHGADVLADGKRLTATGVLNNGMDYESQALIVNEGGTVATVMEPGFDNQPVKRVRPEVPALDGTKDVYLSLRGSDKPVLGFFKDISNDDAMPNGTPLVINGEWFDRGISFKAPNDFTFNLDGKYQWLTFHAQVAEGVTLQINLDGKTVKEIPASKDAQYVAISVAGGKTLKLQGVLPDPSKKQRSDILLGHLRLSPSKTEPTKDPGIARGWKTIPGYSAAIPPVALAFDKCDSVTILLGAKTSYLADHTKGWRGAHPHGALTALMDKAAKKAFSELLGAHEKDYRSLYGRVSLDLGTSGTGILPVSSGSDQPLATGKMPVPLKDLPTDRRFQRYAKGEADPGFESLVFQFGRYLLIASSRPGGLPANLQGVWNDSTRPPWRGDYHSNIDLQMNYWPSDLTGLGECHVPLLDFIAAQAPVYRKNMLRDPEMVKRFPNHRGWTLRTETGVFGASSWELNTPANAWYCHHLWQHYEFGQDRAYLREKAYPLMKETCEFWIDHLITMPDGRLATPDGWSAEWGPREPAVTYDQELIWDLFNNTVAAADVLGVDKAFRDQIAGMRDKLVTPSIGKHGQLKEWFEDKDDMTSTYRHVSHLWALYPGKQITLQGTPELAAAAKVSLNARTDDTPGRDSAGGVAWSIAWKINFWARLRDGDRAYTLVRKFVRPEKVQEKGKLSPDNFLAPNLINRQYQLEGPWGFTAGIAEMLLQSHISGTGFQPVVSANPTLGQDAQATHEIHLLPALPAAWPTGKVTGLRARGNFTVDIEWKDGKVTHYRITSPQPREIKVRANGQVKTVMADTQ